MLAGFAAESALLGNACSGGSAQDFDLAVGLAYLALEMPGGMEALGPWTRTVPLPECLLDVADASDPVLDYLERAYAMTFRLAMAYDQQIGALGLRLLEERSVSGRDVFTIVRHREYRRGALDAILAPYSAV